MPSFDLSKNDEQKKLEKKSQNASDILVGRKNGRKAVQCSEKILTFYPSARKSYRNKRKLPFFPFHCPLVFPLFFFFFFPDDHQPSNRPFTVLSVAQFVGYICILLFLMYQNFHPMAFVMDMKEPFLNYSAYAFMMIALFYCK